jgi:transcriptional regulator with PAS, ATPase and Fis domain
MSKEFHKAILIVTNHFTVEPVNPKIVYANQHFLNMLGCNLSDIEKQDPSKVFKNWNNNEFIQEIVNCVEQKINWVGDLQVIDKNSKISARKFVITPVYNIKNDINFYSCSTLIDADLCTNADDCLDGYVDSMSEFYEHFQSVCEKSPANLLRMDTSGNINYINSHAQKHFNLNIGCNLFEIIEDNANKIKRSFSDKNILGKVSKINFDFFSDQSWSVQCKFWPINDDQNNIIGYSAVLIDNTKRKDITKQLLALKGV